MVVYTLYVKADLEGVASLGLVDNANVCVSVRNPLDPTQTREKIVVDPTELESPALNGHDKHRSTAHAAFHLAIKWDATHDGDHRATLRLLTAKDHHLDNKKEKGSKGHRHELEQAVAKLRDNMTHADS
eukprot:2305047-Ditylum_brightwellii.AAC.1